MEQFKLNLKLFCGDNSVPLHFHQGVLFLFAGYFFILLGLPFVAQVVKRLPAMLETWVRSVGQEDPLEKEAATHSSTLA